MNSGREVEEAGRLHPTCVRQVLTLIRVIQLIRVQRQQHGMPAFFNQPFIQSDAGGKFNRIYGSVFPAHELMLMTGERVSERDVDSEARRHAHTVR